MRTEGVTAVHHRNGIRQIGKKERFIASGIPSADYNDMFVPKEGAVAGSAVRNTFALQFSFSLYTEAAMLRPRRKDDGKRRVGCPGGSHGKSFISVFCNGFRLIGRKLCTEAYRLFTHIFSKVEAVNRFRVSGIIFERID